jgi:hypothetical protein
VNAIGSNGFRELESMLMTNKTMLYLDIRDNIDLSTYNFSKKILERLRGNINVYRRAAADQYNPMFEAKLLEAYDHVGQNVAPMTTTAEIMD